MAPRLHGVLCQDSNQQKKFNYGITHTWSPGDQEAGQAYQEASGGEEDCAAQGNDWPGSGS